jgi:hypothetical protein
MSADVNSPRRQGFTPMAPHLFTPSSTQAPVSSPLQKGNPVVSRILAGEQFHDNVFTRDSAELFDPVRCPRMHEIARAALDYVHTSKDITWDDHGDSDRDPFVPFSADDPALYVYKVGSGYVTVCRNPKAVGAFTLATVGPDRSRRGVDYFAGMYRLMTSLHNGWWADGCSIELATGCAGNDRDDAGFLHGPTQLMPLLCGSVLLIIEICTPCLDYATEAARTGYELSVMEARMRADLPPDAVITPDPEPAENPEAWA